MTPHQELVLPRDCDAIQIPSGHPIVLPAGMSVVVTQALGGTYTVATPGGLARISAEDAEAVGILTETPATPPPIPSDSAPGELNENLVWDQLKTVYDPEIPVNVVDLGLIYDCQIQREGVGANVHVKMTLTAPGCGMGPTIAADARSKILRLDGVTDAEVELVWDPPWNQGMISEAGRMKLGLV